MTRLLLITLLVLSSGPAYAEWVVVDKKEGVMTTCVDPATIRRKGDLVKVWELYDYKTIQTTGYDSSLSNKVLSEYDCSGECTRVLAFAMYSGNMGNGKVVDVGSFEGKWSPVLPDSIGQTLWEVACGKP